MTKNRVVLILGGLALVAGLGLVGGGANAKPHYPPPTTPTTLPPSTTVPPVSTLPPQCDDQGQPDGCVPPPDCSDGCQPPPCFDPLCPPVDPCPPGSTDPQCESPAPPETPDVPAPPVAAEPGVTG